MKSNKQIQQNDLLISVLEVSSILQARRPDLKDSTINILLHTETILRKDNLSDVDLKWIDEQIIHYLCHPKYLYDFCPLERLNEETNQARWQRWGQILDRMVRQAVLLCKNKS